MPDLLPGQGRALQNCPTEPRSARNAPWITEHASLLGPDRTATWVPARPIPNPLCRPVPSKNFVRIENDCICQARIGNLSEPCWDYSSVCVIVSARASPCKLKCLPSAINS